MEDALFNQMQINDERHWWFVGRRIILNAVIARALPRRDVSILEIGCGTGHNISFLSQYGEVDATEINPTAREIAVMRTGKAIINTGLPELKGVPDGHYDMVVLLDVLEHVKDDREALVAIRSKLKDDGILIITVPANQWMWSYHDIINHHHRRYSRRQLSSICTAAGLKIRYLSFFNSLLYPVAAAVRLIDMVRDRREADDKMPSPGINGILTKIFAFERHFLGRVSLPFGVSLVAVVHA